MIKKISIITAFLSVFQLAIGQGNSKGINDHYFELAKNLEIFSDLYKQLDLFYVDEEEPGKLIKKGIDAMLASLDPYTIYIPESKIEDYRFMTTGQYGGIGALIRQSDEGVIISEPYEGFPAHNADIKAGDLIIEIDGKQVKDKSSEEVSKLLKGQQGTELKLKIKRNKETLEKKLIRAEVKVDAVSYYDMINEDIGYIKLNSFTQSSYEESRDAFDELKGKGMKKLIFDLRGNGGGLLMESVNIVNMFVKKGQKVVETKGRIEAMNKEYKAMNDPKDLDIPIVVLVDGGSASASEIVSGSLQDLDRAVIVGTTTFGKGLVQQTRDLDYNSMLKLTVAKYYTPSGRCIQKLDYSNKTENGVEAVPDSLLATFETLNGRNVKDGRGIEPDVHIKVKPYSRFAAKLVTDEIIFDYATKFYYKNESIKPAGEFEVTDEMYNDFVEYVKGREFEYTTASEEIYKELESVAKKEEYYDLAKEEFQALLDKLHPSTERDLKLFKNEVIEILENEIVSRYYYQKGRVEVSLDADPYIMTAQKLFDAKDEFLGILNGSSDPKVFDYTEEESK